MLEQRFNCLLLSKGRHVYEEFRRVWPFGDALSEEPDPETVRQRCNGQHEQYEKRATDVAEVPAPGMQR